MTRPDYVLAVLAAGDGEPLDPTQVQKLFFLLERKIPQEIEGPRFNFIPHAYGPFDKAVYEELRALSEKQLVVIGGERYGVRTYWLTPRGFAMGKLLLDQLPGPTADYIRKLSAWVREVSFEQLVSSIYHEYPDMAIHGVFARG